MKQLKYSILSLQKRLLVLFLLITFIFCAIVIRLFVIQGLNSTKLTLRAAEQWLRTLPLSARRGDIVDSTGSKLATSYTTYDVYIRAKDVTDPARVASFLSTLLNLDYDKLYQKATDKFVSESLVKLSISDSVARQIIDKNYKGVVLSQNIDRYYPYGQFLSQILGYTTIDNQGQSGLEAYYDIYLKGVNGKNMTQSTASGKELQGTLQYYLPSVDGLSIQLTIDSKIQHIVENTLAKIMLDHNPKSASITILEPNSGKTLAMGIAPSFDNNNPPRDNISALMSLSKNTSVVDVYEPGSTFKILTISAALSQKLTTLEERFYCPGYRIVDGQRIKCWRTIGHGSQTLTEGIANSCNCVFMDLALRLGKNKLYDYLQSFGIGSQTGVDILGESSGILMNINNVKNVDLARIGFGQAVAVTQIQLLSAFCAAVNGGKLYRPYLVDNIYDQYKIIKQNKPLILSQVIDQEVSNQVNSMLEGVLSIKNGKFTFVEGYSIGGKTGTAQKYENGKIASGKYVSSFFGTYPASNPQYAILLCVNEPSSGAYYGSVVAAPYAKDVFKSIFEYKNIPPDNTQIQPTNILVPNLVGMPLSQAMTELELSNIYYEIDGDGDRVVSQIPAPNSTISQSSYVIISTN